MASLRLRGRLLRNPVRVVPLAFLAAVATGTAVLMLPAAREGPYQADPLTALFTATSAVCVTGLIVEDTPTYWSPVGQAVIMILFQVGGFGIMTMATLLTVLVVRRLGLATGCSRRWRPNAASATYAEWCCGSAPPWRSAKPS